MQREAVRLFIVEVPERYLLKVGDKPLPNDCLRLLEYVSDVNYTQMSYFPKQ